MLPMSNLLFYFDYIEIEILLFNENQRQTYKNVRRGMIEIKQWAKKERLVNRDFVGGRRTE